jgi:phage replication-related protein YjqB (UPF0714/DUF867 family)
MRKDKYSNFDELSKNEPIDNFRIDDAEIKGAILIIAPHGGKIEPGTS